MIFTHIKNSDKVVFLGKRRVLYVCLTIDSNGHHA